MLIQAAIIKSDHLLFWSTRHSPAPSGSSLLPPSPFPGPHSHEHVDWASAGSENWSRSWLKLLCSRSGLNSCLSPSIQPQDKQLLLFTSKMGGKMRKKWNVREYRLPHLRAALGLTVGQLNPIKTLGKLHFCFCVCSPSRANIFQSKSSCSQN